MKSFNQIQQNMTRYLLVLIFIFLMPDLISAVPKFKEPDINAMKLVWNDEFKSDSKILKPDQKKWKYQLGNSGWGNKEIENYTDSINNAYISNGTLKIVARKNSNGNWTSARLNSKFSFTYGYLEARLKVPSELGTWPAFWMMPEEPSAYGAWPQSGEIDVIEHCPNAPFWGHQGFVFSTVHYGKSTEFHRSSSLGHTTFKTASSQFHTYAILWTKDSITAFYDGKPIGNGYDQKGKSWTKWPFNKNFYILLNLAMGGTLGGKIANNYNKAVYEIDYVRVYQNK